MDPIKKKHSSKRFDRDIRAMTAGFWTVNNTQFLRVKIRITELPNFYNYKSLNIAFLRANTKTFRKCQKLLFFGGIQILAFFDSPNSGASYAVGHFFFDKIHHFERLSSSKIPNL